MKRYIYAMSWNRRDLAGWIEEHRKPVAHALAQLYLFPNSQYENHWRQEVWAGFNEMKRLRQNNQLPSAKFIYDNVWETIPDGANQAIRWAIRHETRLSPKRNYSVQEFNQIASEYFQWLASELCKNEDIFPEDTYEQLDKLNL